MSCAAGSSRAPRRAEGSCAWPPSCLSRVQQCPARSSRLSGHPPPARFPARRPPMPELAMDSQSLWSACAAGDIDARNALLREHLSLVHHVARKLARHLADDADLDELVSAGTMGLLGAAEAFDAGRGL